MADMPHWNAFVREVLKGQQDKPDREDNGNRCEQLNIIKRVENNSDFSEKERLKDGESK